MLHAYEHFKTKKLRARLKLDYMHEPCMNQYNVLTYVYKGITSNGNVITYKYNENSNNCNIFPYNWQRD